MKPNKHEAGSLKHGLLLPSIVGIVVGVSSSFVSFWLSGIIRPNVVRWDAYQRTYDKRVTLYGELMKLFPEAYFLEREIKDKNIAPAVAVKMRMDLHKKYHLLLATGVPIMTNEIFCTFLAAHSDYITGSTNFTDEVRRKWIENHYDKLVKAIRKDVGADAAGAFALNFK